MAKQVLKITNWVGGLNSATDPRDIQENQFAQNWNVIDDVGGILRKVGGAEDSIINLDHNNAKQQTGYGLFTMQTDHNISPFNGTFNDGYERGQLQAYASGTPSVTLAANPVYGTSTLHATNDYYNNWTILIYDDDGEGESRTITDYVGSTKVATIDAAFSATPDSGSLYLIFRWLSSDFGTSNDNNLITNNDGANAWPDTDGNYKDEAANYHLITTKASITDHQSSEMGYVELKGSGDSGGTVSSLTIKPGVLYYLSFYAKSNKKYNSYVSNNPHCERVPFFTLHSTTTTDGTDTGMYLFSNNHWISDSDGTVDVQKNFVTNGDFETGTGTGGTDSGPTSWTRIGTDLTCSYLTSNEYGSEGNTLQMAAGSGLALADIEIITNAVDRTIASGTINWVEYSPSTTLGGYTEDTSTDDRIEITGTTGTTKEGAELGTSFMTTLIAGRTYRVSASVYCASGTMSTFKFELGGVATSAFTISTDTSPIEKLITVTSDAALRIYYEANNTTQWFIDDISVKAVDPSSFIYQDLSLDDKQAFDLNFIHASSSGAVQYAIYDTNSSVYLTDWTHTTGTGSISTYKYLNQTTEATTAGSRMSSNYEKFFVDTHPSSAGTNRTIRIMFSGTKASQNFALDGITVFKAWNDLLTMSHNSFSANPFTNNVLNWNKYSTTFKLPPSFSETSDWVFRLNAGRAAFQDGATDGITADVNTHTVEFDDIRLESQGTEDFTFLSDNSASFSHIKIHSSASGEWDSDFIAWPGLNARPVYNKVHDALKISDGNFETGNTNILFYFYNRNIIGRYPVSGHDVITQELCDNPNLKITFNSDSEVLTTVMDGIAYVNATAAAINGNDSGHFETTNWDTDNIGEFGIVMRYFQYGTISQGYDSDWGGWPGWGGEILDPSDTTEPMTQIDNRGIYAGTDGNYIPDSASGRSSIYIWIQGDDGSANDMASKLSAGGDIHSVDFEFDYSVFCDRRWKGSSGKIENDYGPVIKVECGKLTGTDASDAFDRISTPEMFEFGKLDWENGITVEQSSQGTSANESSDRWTTFINYIGEGQRNAQLGKTCSGTFSFEPGQIAKTDDIILKISTDYNSPGENFFSYFTYYGDSGQSNTNDTSPKHERIKFNTLNIQAYDTDYTPGADSVVLSSGDEVQVNWSFGTPTGSTASFWEEKKFKVGVTSVNIFGEENHISEGNLLIGEATDGSPSITAGQCPNVNVYMGNNVLKDKYKKETKIYLKDNEIDIWYLQFIIDHETGKLHSKTSGFVGNPSIHTDNNCTSWQIQKEDMLSPNLVDTYESETFLEKTYTDENRANMTCRYKTAVVANNRLYAGNIYQNGKIYSDRMIISPPDKYNILPDSNFIDVAINDGDEITGLAFFKDKLLQFKKQKVFVINTSGDYEFLEETFDNVGVQQQCQITNTPFGIVWANQQGCFIYTGKEFQNLIDGKIAPTEDSVPIASNSWLVASNNSYVPLVGYVEKKKALIVIIDKDDYATVSIPEGYEYSFLTQSWTMLHRRTYDSGNCSSNGNKSNMAIDRNGDLIWHVYESPSTNKIVKWSDGARSNLDTTGNDTSVFYFTTKDYDFGQPAVRKKIYKIYVTYKSTDVSGAADSKAKLQYATNGGSSYTDFPAGTNYHATNGFEGATAWTTAIIKPSSSINNVYSFQLRFLGVIVPKGFAINDVSIIYRIKRPK